VARFELVVQKAIYDKLVLDLSVPIYDQVPQPNDSGDSADFPYVTIGEDNHVTIDTDTELMNQVSIVIHTWSRYRGRKETKDLQGQIYDSLHRSNLSASGYNFVNIAQVDNTSFLDADGFTRHGVQTFNLIIEEL